MHRPGGCTFAADPALCAPQARPVWRAEIDPAVISVSVAAPGEDRCDWFEPRRFERLLTLVEEGDGHEHIVLSDGFRRLRIAIEEGSLADMRPVTLRFRVEGMATARAQLLSLRRFLGLCRTGRFSDALFPRDKRVRRGLEVLRVHDALRAGASQREIAADLFGPERVPADWRIASDALRSRVRRLVREARRMAGGGYRQPVAGRRAGPP